jgi:primosomal protein N' (replication factor Y)
MYAAVFPLTRSRAFSDPFDYAIPEGMRSGLRLGSLVAVPLGTQVVIGMVLGIAATTAHRGAVVPLRAVLELPPVPEDLVALALRVRDHYLCPLAAALALVTPPAGALRVQRVLEATAAGREALAAGDADLGPFALPVPLASGTRPPPATERLRRAGLLAVRYDVHVVGGDRPPERCLQRGEETPKRVGARQRAALEYLQTAGVCTDAELRRECGLTATALESLERSRAVRPADEGQACRTVPAGLPEAETAPELLPEQADALAEVLAAVERDDGAQVLVHGVTGSGKTEVYLRAAAEVLARGRSVAVLVPEIALTGQTVARFRARFPGELLVVVHSSLPVGERLAAYRAAAECRARIVVGARSAVFAPLCDLGLLIVDEEQDDSYKQGSQPRYDARTVARWRAAGSGAALVFGSATPSVDTWARVRRHSRLRARVDGSPPPSLEIVDLRDGHGVLCSTLRQALVQCIDAGQKAILFLNRRGMASYVSCAHCGHTWVCPACDVAFSLFRRGTELRCRVCGKRQPAPHLCPVCGGLDVGRHGVGTEELETEVGRLLPGIELLRLDSDVAASYPRLRAVLDRFGEPGARVLVGTQMVAKGHHFPEVTLVGVVNADLALYFPDYRAEERTFAMLLQVGGRAGRGEHPGRVVVQTYNPQARPILFAAAGDEDGFYPDELQRRRLLGYPPATTLLALEASALGFEDLVAAATDLATAARSAYTGDVTVVGPGPVWRERGRLYCRTVVKTTNAGETIAETRALVASHAAAAGRRGVRIMVDVEPVRL